MFKATVFALLFVAVPAGAVAVSPGGPGLKPSNYSNSYSSQATAMRNGQLVTTHSASGTFIGPVMVTDPFVTLSVGATPTPFVIARANGVGGVQASSSGNIQYYFAVTGGASVAVPLSAHVVIDAIVGGSANSVESDSGVVNVFTDLQSVTRTASAEIGGSGAPGPTHTIISEDVSFLATANVLNLDQIQVLGSASIAEAFGAKGFATLFADPVLTIDPTWALSHPSYTLQFSPFVGNVAGPAGVPEPAEWALMIAGFGLTGAVARRRRQAIA